jgi:lysozyme
LVKVPLTQNQFDALVDFVFNVGAHNFEKSTLLIKLNKQDYKGAAEEFPRWNRAAGHVLGGLIRRRGAERTLFLTQE